MFQRIRDTLKKERELKAQVSEQARAEGRAEGKAQGRAEGIAQGRAEGKAQAYREITEWNNRRMAAGERGEKFTEPFPGANLNR